MKTHRMTEEEMEGPISFWGYKEQESNLILPEHDDNNENNVMSSNIVLGLVTNCCQLLYWLHFLTS